MKKTLTIFTLLTVLAFIISSIAVFTPVAGEIKYKVYGYIFNAEGQALSGADVIFNVPQIVPGCTTNASGYYEMNAPAGTYHVNVWPPYNSNYINYDEQNLVVNADMPKNITLQSGCKVSGYLSDPSGNKISGAGVYLGNYASGYFTNSYGYYFISVPAGTYTLTARPGNGLVFSVYTEPNVVVSGAMTKNITVGATSTPTLSPTQPPTQNPTATPTPTPTPIKYKIAGYIQNAEGQGIQGACIIFNVPNIVPCAYSDSSGYYQIFAPTGTYHVNVWPAYNSSYINYDETGFTVTESVSKNITLPSGNKVCGYIKDAQGTPMVGASVLFKAGGTVYGSGYFTNAQGYYYAAIPAGTYTIDAHPQTAYDPSYQGTCTYFPTYLEYNFEINSDLAKNITVGTSTTTPTPTNRPSQPNPTSNPTNNPAPTAAPNPTLPASYITIQTDASTYNVGSKLIISGTLSDQNQNPIVDKTIVLSYSLDGGTSWIEVGSSKTDSQGQYRIQWIISASGAFTLKAAYAGSSTQAAAQDTTTLSFLPYEGQKVFFVESNSTVTGLTFDSQTLTVGFTVSGPTGSAGYTKVTVAKTLIANFTGITVAIDQTPVQYTVTSSGEYWIVEFNYHHSTHAVSIGLNELTSSAFTVDTTIIAIIAIIVIAAAVGGFAVIRHSKRTK
jgi:hypothetical protein